MSTKKLSLTPNSSSKKSFSDDGASTASPSLAKANSPQNESRKRKYSYLSESEDEDEIQVISQKTPPSKRLRFDLREMDYKIVDKLNELSRKYQVKPEVIFHALIITGGNFTLAERYLKRTSKKKKSMKEK